jgi:hypothetical protein
MMKDDQDKVLIYCAAASMYAKAHDVKLSNVTFEEICKFMDGLDEVQKKSGSLLTSSNTGMELCGLATSELCGCKPHTRCQRRSVC